MKALTKQLLSEELEILESDISNFLEKESPEFIIELFDKLIHESHKKIITEIDRRVKLYSEMEKNTKDKTLKLQHDAAQTALVFLKMEIK